MTVVTGAFGLVGRAVCELLAARNERVLRVGRVVVGDGSTRDALAIDLSREPLDADAVGEVGAVIHLAAAVPHSPRYPDTDASAALTRCIDAHIEHFVRQHDCRLVYASSCGLYDRFSPYPKHEDDVDAIVVRSPYFAAKLEGERRFLESCDAVIARLSAPIGPGLQPALVVSRFMAAARAGNVIQLWGSGTREQDFADVRDVARFLVDAAVGAARGVVNVASGRAITMRELADAVITAVGRGRVEFANRPDPEDGATARYAIAKAASVFGWQPRHSLADALSSIAA